MSKKIFHPIHTGGRAPLELRTARAVAKLLRFVAVANEIKEGRRDPRKVPTDYPFPDGFAMPERVLSSLTWCLKKAHANGFIEDISAPNMAVGQRSRRIGAKPPKRGVNGARTAYERRNELMAWGIIVKGDAEQWTGPRRRKAWNTAQLLDPSCWAPPPLRPGQGRQKAKKDLSPLGREIAAALEAREDVRREAHEARERAQDCRAGRMDQHAPGATPLLNSGVVNSSPLTPLAGEESASADTTITTPSPSSEEGNTANPRSPAARSAVASRDEQQTTTTPSPSSEEGNQTVTTPPAAARAPQSTAPPAQPEQSRATNEKEHAAGHASRLARLVATFCALFYPGVPVASLAMRRTRYVDRTTRALHARLVELGENDAGEALLHAAIENAPRVARDGIRDPVAYVLESRDRVIRLARAAVPRKVAGVEPTPATPKAADMPPRAECDRVGVESTAALLARWGVR